MGSTRDILHGARPVALSHRADGWVLELERFVRIRSGHYRPKRIRVAGLDKILRQLADQGVDAGLVEEIKSMMGAPNAALGTFRVGEGTLEPVDGDLDRPEDALDQLAQLEPKVKELQWKNQSLERRIAELERVMRSGMPMRSSDAFEPAPGSDGGGFAGPRAGRAARAEEPTGGEEAFGGGFAGPADGASERQPGGAQSAPEAGMDEPSSDGLESAEPADEAPAGAGSGAEPEGAGDDSDSDAEAQPTDDESSEPPEDPILQLPMVEDYLDGLHGLVGDEIGLSADEARPELDGGGWFISPLLNDDDEVVGALLADLKATVRQGGGLIMLPDAALEEMETATEASEDAIDAMGELFNVQSRYFNDIEDNPHVKVDGFVPVDSSEHSWVMSPASRSDFVDTFGGRTVVLSR